jgi:RimJ/RimL family protein N-acetyltransferase
MGYWFGEPYWGKGYATEAGRRLLRFAFEERELDGIAAGHYWENHASGRVLTKLGFRYTHEVMRHCLARGHDVRCLMMCVSREAFVATAQAA